ncbi:Uncharacterized protein FWK35_00002500 [Aphis craccivora]|uniref:Uncharacterized protein n=1 Tax=Aphis craccivora TaxID=307492 RepID=A0A6G0Z0T3_APHCR|nr:Uncharacterized protein FWK35_00002500 [Aphis craccivora]
MCSKDQQSPARCTLYTKEHTANFKGCPVYKATFKKTVHPAKGSDSNTYQKTKSYAEATINHQNLHAELKITDTLKFYFKFKLTNYSPYLPSFISLKSTHN